MPSKRVTVVLAVLLGALAAAPTGAAGETRQQQQQEEEQRQQGQQCPPGVTDATYCAVSNASGLSLSTHALTSLNDSSVDLTLPCKARGNCSGKLYFEGSKGKKYGITSISIKHGKHATLHIRLTAAGRKALEKAGKVTVTVAVVSNGVRSVIGTLTIKGHKTR